jgi:hypothetical protein
VFHDLGAGITPGGKYRRDVIHLAGALDFPTLASEHIISFMDHRELRSRVLFDCQFVPLLGRYGWSRDDYKSSRDSAP